MLLILIAVLAQAAGGPPGLVWHGAAVHPGCVGELSTSVADSRPIVAAVDLEGCGKSNKYSDAPETHERWLHWKIPDGGYFQYQYLGVLTNGVHVVRTGESGGGSGYFQSLLFLRITTSTVVEDGVARARDALTLVGSESLGDRDQATITLSGNAVTIKRREFRGAAGYGPEKTTVRRVQ